MSSIGVLQNLKHPLHKKEDERLHYAGSCGVCERAVAGSLLPIIQCSSLQLHSSWMDLSHQANVRFVNRFRLATNCPIREFIYICTNMIIVRAYPQRSQELDVITPHFFTNMESFTQRVTQSTHELIWWTVWERDRERGRERGKGRERERERKLLEVSWRPHTDSCVYSVTLSIKSFPLSTC